MMDSGQSPPSQRPLLPEFDACFSGPSSSASSARREMQWGLWSPHDASWMGLVRRNYEQHRRSAVATDGSRLIPRTIHHIWLGSPLPEACARLRESWLTRHESWTVRLWGDADVEEFGLENREAYDAAGNFGEKSDILRYEILLRHGGVYVDVDFLCLGAFDDLHRRYDFYAGVSNTGTFELNNGLVGCRPGHPIMREIVNRIKDYSGANLPQQRGTGSHDPSSVSIGVAELIPPSLVGGCLRSQSGGVLAASKAGAEGTGPGAAAVVKALAMSPGAAAGGASGGGCGGSGDPLAALMGALGAGGGGGGLLGGFLGGDDQTRLEAAVKVEPGSATATIIKTGPGVFTRAVMEWMVATTDDTSRAAIKLTDGENFKPAEEKIELAEGTTELVAEGASAAVANARVMLLPPSYLYPVPNNAEGDLIGDGGEEGVRERAGRFFSKESLAAHLWGRSWQQGVS